MTSSIGISPGPVVPAPAIHGLVDIVAHTMTIACGRLKREDFSSVYFDAHQRVLVLDPWTELKGPPTRVPASKAAEYGS
jgi:ABC-type amino acid transport substrate-binding protein